MITNSTSGVTTVAGRTNVDLPLVGNCVDGQGGRRQPCKFICTCQVRAMHMQLEVRTACIQARHVSDKGLIQRQVRGTQNMKCCSVHCDTQNMQQCATPVLGTTGLPALALVLIHVYTSICTALLCYQIGHTTCWAVGHTTMVQICSAQCVALQDSHTAVIHM